MMSKQNYIPEENIANLVQLGFETSARLDVTKFNSFKQHLISQIPSTSSKHESSFPEQFLPMLGIILALLVTTVISQKGHANTLYSFYFISALVVILNIVCIPLSTILIILRRRCV